VGPRTRSHGSGWRAQRIPAELRTLRATRHLGPGPQADGRSGGDVALGSGLVVAGRCPSFTRSGGAIGGGQR